MSNKRNKMFNLEFFQVFSDTVFQPGHSSYGLEMDMAMCSSWALSRLLGPVTSLGSSLNNRHSPWASGQLGKAPRPWPGWSQLEKAEEGWTKAGQGLWAWTGLNWLAQHTGTLLCWLTPESAVFEHFKLCTFFGTSGSFGSLWPHIGHQNVTGPPGALLFDRDQRSHWKNHFNCSFVRLATWAFIAQISCHRC